MKISVVGLGYVGLSNAVVLAQRHEVVAVDLNAERVDQVNRRESPLVDDELEDYLAHHDLTLTATTDASAAVPGSDFVIVATPTDYDPVRDFFNTSSVESVIASVAELAPEATVVVKSTVPVGFTERMRTAHPGLDIVFSPEFLREGRALHDNLHPSRVVIGGHSEAAIRFGELLVEGALDTDVPLLHTNPTEAEAIKLFANTFLAMRVAYFDELRIAIITWIERTYHRRRRQDALGRLTPHRIRDHHDHASRSGSVTRNCHLIVQQSPGLPRRASGRRDCW